MQNTKKQKQQQQKLSVQFSPNTFFCLLEIGILRGKGEKGGEEAIKKS